MLKVTFCGVAILAILHRTFPNGNYKVIQTFLCGPGARVSKCALIRKPHMENGLKVRSAILAKDC